MADAASSRRKVSLIALAGALTVACQPSPSPSPSPTPGPSATAEASGTPVFSPTPTPGPISIVWADQTFAGTVTAVTTDQGQFVAVGGTTSSIAAWTSSDGASWDSHPVSVPTIVQLNLDPAFAQWITDPQVWPPMMGRMARFGDTLLSFGTFFGPIDYLRPVGWRTTNVMTWEFVESTNTFFTDGYGMMDLVSSGEELVALNRGFGEHTGGSWRWTPGTSWVQTTPSGANYTASGLSILDAVWAGDQFVVVGQANLGQTASSWISPTGQSWQASPSDPALAGGIMRSVAVAPDDSIVAVGNLVGVPTAWTSSDGLSWTSVSLPGGGSAEVHGLASLDGGLLAIGEAGSGVLTWTSPNGTVWQAGPVLDGTVLRHESQQSGGETLAVNGDVVTLFVVQGVETVQWRGEIQP